MINYKSELIQFLKNSNSTEKSYAQKIISKLKESKYICIFGAGQMGRSLACLFRELNIDIKVDFFCDNDKEKWGQVVCNEITCISPTTLKSYKESVAIIIATKYYEEIVEQLKKEGITNLYPIVTFFYFKNNILYGNNASKIELIQDKLSQVMDALADEQSQRVALQLVKNWFAESPAHIDYKSICTANQYFDDSVIKLGDKEIFVDAGAYDGGTILEFLQKVQNKFTTIYSFELDRKNFSILEETMVKMDSALKSKIHIYNIGLWDKRKTIRYNELIQGSNIEDEGEIEGNVDALDNVLCNSKVTLIKMDIEGAELKALQGAAQSIKNYKPKMAICVYHNPEDLWEISLYLKSIVPEYKIYLRHYTTFESETVCYAVI
ncbi:FkbM family methyltransferase [Sporomusaceae bacterium BoRhaA]|uniref:FkbM family methyltransferase n=1 Tax=Pelorhabdus rhamnosifermentans TaxID=2772457 RepID=UPI001C062700|nr:FkbM family methyltransferase [Pelorhabdus rhamnosifermentans]MBU2703218.1 FkbM family methyltransferase [Pelorhabdus rhamnosifermentans]